MSCWFKTDDKNPPGRELGLVGKYQAAYWNGYQMNIQGDGSIWPWYVLYRGNDVIGNYDVNNDNNPAFKSQLILDAAWHQATFTVDSDAGNLYIDGQLVSTKPWRGKAAPVSNTLPLEIGRYAGANSGFFKGSMDDVRIYNRSLSSGEVLALYSVDNPGAPPGSKPGPVPIDPPRISPEQPGTGWEGRINYNKQYSSAFYAKVLDQSNNPIDSTDSQLAIFNGDQVTGVASPVPIGAQTLYNMNVYADQPQVKGMTLKVYNASTREIQNIQETYDFTNGDYPTPPRVGSLENPLVFHVSTSTQGQLIPLSRGWNWVSFNVLPADKKLESLLQFYSPTEGDVINSNSGSAIYTKGKWYLSTYFKLEFGRMYKIYSSSNRTLVANGIPVSGPVEVSLEKGWNYLGNPYNSTVRVKGIFTGAALPSQYDYIQSQNGKSATYVSGVWYPNISSIGNNYPIDPGSGHMMYISGPIQIQIQK